ncbi:dienelactone hydrolase family protein [Piscinibacter sp.]|jgi:dienelactone hydrolase|uniref:dienelactone hydrolase family protein n=1 Tax=Piscinibacter sp. TaxID=1903157 RepID=UPI002F410E2B
MRRLLRGALTGLFMAWLWGSTPARAEVELSFPSLDTSGGPGLMLKAFWFEAPVSAPAPAVVLLHGCGGAYDARGVLSQRMRDYAALLNRHGLHALIVDSLTPRGEKQICTQKVRSRLITRAHRRLDALSSLAWLATRPDVDASRLGLLGWSNGGSTVLAATNMRHKEVAGAEPKPAFAVAFYPGCEAELKRGYETQTRLLMLVGEADDWTAAEPCKRLAAQAQGHPPEIESYAGAYHGFDSTATVRVRTDVPGGVNPGRGVHVGGNAQAMKRSRERLMQFIGVAGS